MRSSPFFTVALVIPILLAVCGAPVKGEIFEMTILPAKDSTIFEENLNSSGAGPHLFTGETVEGHDRRLLLAFDFSVLPPDALVSEASLTLVLNRSRFGVVPVAVHRLLAEWGEGTSNSGDRGGDGVAATPNDATWRHRLFNTETWTNEGGDFDPIASATVPVDNLNAYTWSSADLVRDVNEWLAGTRQNYGWILVADGGAKRFHSREGAPNIDRPRLKLTFETLTPPAPTGLRLDSASDTGVDGTDRITRDDTPTITGDAIPGSNVTLFINGVAVGNGPGGPGFAITTTPLGEGESVITAKAMRPGGEPGQESEPLRIRIDTTPPTVTLEQAPGTPDPASGASVGFRVVFSEAVGGFLRGDVNVGGTANPRSIRIATEPPFDGSAYRVDVSGMTTEGTVVAAIAADIVEDPAGNPNESHSSAAATIQFERFGETPDLAFRAPLVGGAFVADGVLFRGDVDFTSFTVTQAVEIRIATNGSVDTVGALFDSRNRMLNDPGIDDDRGGEGNYTITRVLGPGLYFVRTTGRTGSAESYQLSIEIVRKASLQPDLLIGERPSLLKGDDSYNLTGLGQTADLGASDRRSASFRGRLENDGDADDEIVLTSRLSDRRAKLHVLIDGQNESAAVRRGGGRRRLEPGSGVNFEGSVKIARTSGVGTSFRLVAVSLDQKKSDVVKGRIAFSSPSSEPVPSPAPRDLDITPASSTAPRWH
jgi:hypothetical protein